jgi:hypothetical protein
MKIATTESEHQKAVIKWADDMVKFQNSKYWMLKYLFAVPNEGQHKPQYRKHQAAMGLKAGVLDLWLPYPFRSKEWFEEHESDCVLVSFRTRL